MNFVNDIKKNVCRKSATLSDFLPLFGNYLVMQDIFTILYFYEIFVIFRKYLYYIYLCSLTWFLIDVVLFKLLLLFIYSCGDNLKRLLMHFSKVVVVGHKLKSTFLSFFSVLRYSFNYYYYYFFLTISGQ